MDKSINEMDKISSNKSKDFIIIESNSSETSYRDIMFDDEKHFSLNSSFSICDEEKELNNNHSRKSLKKIKEDIIEDGKDSLKDNHILNEAIKNMDFENLIEPSKLSKQKEVTKKKKLSSGKIEKLSKKNSNSNKNTNFDSNSKLASNQVSSEIFNFKSAQEIKNPNLSSTQLPINCNQYNVNQHFNPMNLMHYPYSSTNLYNPYLQNMYLNQYGMLHPNSIPYLYQYNYQNGSYSDKNFTNTYNQNFLFNNAHIQNNDNDKRFILSYSKSNEFDKIYKVSESNISNNQEINSEKNTETSIKKSSKKVKFKKTKIESGESKFKISKNINSDFSKSFSESYSSNHNIELEKQLYDLESNFENQMKINHTKDKNNIESMNVNQFIDFLVNENGIAAFICTHNGCKIFQKKISFYDEKISLLIINDILKNKALEEVMTSIYANYIFQKALEKSNFDIRIKILKKLKKVNGSTFFTNACCSHSFQFLCSKINTEEEFELVDKIISRDCFTLSKDKNGSHVIMKAIIQIPEKNRSKLNSKLIEYTHLLSYEKYGVCVVSHFLIKIKKLFSETKNVRHKIIKIIEKAGYLNAVLNPYTNYLIQIIIKNRLEDNYDINELIDIIVDNSLLISSLKFSSNIINSILDEGSNQDKEKIINNVLNPEKLSLSKKNKYIVEVIKKCCSIINQERLSKFLIDCKEFPTLSYVDTILN